MLTEQFVASLGTPTKAPGPGVPKDAAIFLHEFQPLSQQRQLLKKSATPPNCLAISPTHIFAAQADKGVVHVYGRDKGNQEATVPFTDKISSIALACDDLVLVLGTVEGRIFLWEIASGRQISTPQAHLQAVTTLAVDPTHNFLLSGSKDSSVNVWSIPSLLSFSRTADAAPLRTFSSHRDEVTSVITGHSKSSCNFAVSISRDQTALVWNYRTGTILRTYLLPSIPLCLDLDPADRAVYVGYEDGTLQLLDLYATTPAGNLQAVQNGNNAAEPVQPPESSRWKLPESKYGAATSVSVSFDGTTVLSGHHAGAILSWDVARGNFVATLTQLELPGPVNNVVFLPVTGFTGEQELAKPHVKDIMKPKFGAFDNAEGGSTPTNYALNVQFRSELSIGPPSDFASALTAPSFSAALIDQGLCELVTWTGKASSHQSNGDVDAANEDYMALDEPAFSSKGSSLQSENESLKQQLEALRRVQKKTFEKMDQLNEERKALLNARSGSKTNGIAADSDDDEDSSD